MTKVLNSCTAKATSDFLIVLGSLTIAPACMYLAYTA